MARKVLYEVVIVLNSEREGEESKIVVDSKRFLALDDRVATMLASRMIPEEFAERMSEVEVKLRKWM